ncbi:hypothetical protein TWF173_010344, partial [Orbilia oligospora]
MSSSSYPGGGSSSASATMSARTETRTSVPSSKVRDTPVKLADNSEPFILSSDQRLEDVESEGERSQK